MGAVGSSERQGHLLHLQPTYGYATLLTTIFAFGALSILSSDQEIASGRLCALARTAVKLACAESPHGVALAVEPQRAAEILSSAEAGVGRFREAFRVAPPRFAVVESDEAALPAKAQDSLRQSGFQTILPWLSAAGYRVQVEQSVRRSIEQQMSGQSPDRVEQVVQQVLARQGASVDRARVETSAIPHELGHDWYRQTFWPGAPRSGQQHYGSAGPDWLDEIAAVLMEPTAAVEKRRAQFARRYAEYRRNPRDADETTRLLIDLPHFLQEPHPTSAAARTFLAQSPNNRPTTGTSVRVLTGPEAERIAGQSGRFYQQAAVVALYLSERAGNPDVLRRIGAAFGQSKTFEELLASGEGIGGLPRDYTALQADWLEWLDNSFAPRFSDVGDGGSPTQ